MLTEKRKADRAQMAAAVVALAHELGAKTVVSDPAPLHPRGIWVEVEAPGGLCVTVDFDGESCQPDVHVVSWHMNIYSEARIASAGMANVNEYHHRKATYVAMGFDELCVHLREVLGMARDGSAYMPAEDKAT